MKPQAKRHGWLYNWVDQRLGLSLVIELMSEKRVPIGNHSILWYYLGGATLFFFGLQLVSGVLLLMYYQPGLSTSYESIRYLTTKVPFGWLVRSVHCWSAHLMVVSLLTHMFSTLLLKAYRRPRELTWVTGSLLLAVTLGFGFSGYLLPWNELAFFATSVGTDSVKSVPLIGDWLLQVLRGGPDVSINTLYRFFALHVVILPLSIVVIIGMHLFLVQRLGMAPPVGFSRPPFTMRFFPNFMLRDLLLWLVCLIAIVSLAVYLPYGLKLPGVSWELGHKADALAPAYPGIKPEWYFLWIYQLLKEFPAHLLGLEGPQAALGLVALFLGFWVLLPWLDRRSQRDFRSPGFSDLAAAVLFSLGFLTLKAWDLGADGAPLAEGAPAQIAWTCASITLAGIAGLVALRSLFLGQRWFWWSAAVALHVSLHGFAGMHYLSAAWVAVLAAIVGLGAASRFQHAAATQSGAKP